LAAYNSDVNHEGEISDSGEHGSIITQCTFLNFIVSYIQKSVSVKILNFLFLLFSWTGHDSNTKNGLHPYRIAYTNTFGKPPWFDFVCDEYSACREQVGLSDYSSFTKIDLWVCMILHSTS
jgi:hypothetical protein